MSKAQIILTICSVAILVSCNQLDRSITEEISVKEIAEITKKDSLFNTTYKMVTGFKELVDDKLLLAKYSDLNWQDIHDYVLFSNDSTYWKNVEQYLVKDYKSKNDSTIQAGLDFIKKWKLKKTQWEQKNDPNNYVKIELIGVKTNYYSYSGSLDDVTLTFRLTPLRDKVQQVIWSINPKAKINDAIDENSISYVLDSQRYIYSSPFSKTITGRYEASYSHEKLFQSKSAKSFLRDYNLNLKVSKVRVEDRNIEVGGFEIPFNIGQYIKYDSGEEIDQIGMKEYYFAEIIKDNINKDYQSKNNYLLEKRSEILSEKFPDEYEFISNYFELLSGNTLKD